MLISPIRVLSTIKRARKQSVENSILYSDIEEVSEVARLKMPIRFHLERKHIIIALILFYLIALPIYFYLGLQPSQENAAAKAAEVEKAVSSIKISSIDLDTPIVESNLNGKTLSVPDYVAARYSGETNKTLIMGHSSTVFKDLKDVKNGDEIEYEGKQYHISSIEIKPKTEISMNKILEKEKQDTLVLMTCYGESLGDQDYSHRLIVYAS